MSVSRVSAPGLIFIVKSTPSLVLPLVGFHGAFFITEKYFRKAIPGPIRVTCYILSIPIYFVSRVLWSVIRKKVKAFSLGLAEVPEIKGKLPGNLDIVQEWGQSQKGSSYVGRELERQFHKFGPIWNSRLIWEDMFHTSQPEHMKAILVNDFQNYGKGKDPKEAFKDFLGTGVVNSDGEMWQFHRTMIRPFFARDKAIQYSIFEQAGEKAVSLLLERTKKDLSTDIQDLFTRYTFDSTVEFLFSMKFGTLYQDLPNPHYSAETSHVDGVNQINPGSLAFAHAFEEAQLVVANRLQFGAYWPLREFFSNWTAKPMRIVDEFLFDCIEKHLKTQKELEGVEEEELNLLDQLTQSINDKVVWKDEILNLFVAAREATAALITFIFYALVNHPSSFARLRAEVLDHLGTDRVPSFDDIKDMKYLRAVINETLRLYPPTPMNFRESIRDTTLPPVTPGAPSIFVPAKTKVMYHTYEMHRRKDLWGPDAQVFDPDRWLDDRLQKYFLANPFIFLPFNAGPRICPGQQFALNETSFMIIRLLQKFENIELDTEAQEFRVKPEWAEGESHNGFSKEKIVIENNLTLYAPGGIWMKFHPTN